MMASMDNEEKTYSEAEVLDLLKKLEGDINASADAIGLTGMGACVAVASRRHAAGMVKAVQKEILNK